MRRGTLRFVLLACLFGFAGPGVAQDPAPSPAVAAVEFERFSARRERSAEGDRVSVSLRLRINGEHEMPCFVFIVVRSEESGAKVWSMWPPQPAGEAISSGGYFHAATPSAGYAVTLTREWQRINATLPEANSATPYDTAVLYVVAPNGVTLLARPFRF